MKDIYKVSTQHSAKSAPTKSSPATLQMGIMESLLLSSADPLQGANPSPAFDDVDRRKKARNVTTHRELEVRPFIQLLANIVRTALTS